MDRASATSDPLRRNGNERPVVERTPLRDYTRTAFHLRWSLAQILVVLPLVTLALSLAQPPVYQASAEVLLSYQNLPSSPTDSPPSPNVMEEPKRIAETQARLARTPAVAARALRSIHATAPTPGQLLGLSFVRADPNADILEFGVRTGNRRAAIELTTAYARAYTEVARELNVAITDAARKGVVEQLRQLEARGDSRSDFYGSLVDKEQQLRALVTLQSSNAALVRSASDAEQVQPSVLRNVLLAVVLAIVIAGGLVIGSTTFGTRLPDADDVADTLGMPLLARLPRAPVPLTTSKRIATLAEPHGHRAVLYRLLKTKFEFATRAVEARTVMFTSVARREGRSTTVANLAVALARGGRTVALVDFDMREPILHRFFGQPRRPGFAEVVGAGVALEDALATAAFDDAERAAGGRQGELALLQAGVMASRGAGHVSELLNTAALSAMLDELRARFELVLIDAPPVAQADEALALSAKVDGLVVVVSSKESRRTTLGDLRALLDCTPAVKLGLVYTGARAERMYRSGEARRIARDVIVDWRTGHRGRLKSGRPPGGRMTRSRVHGRPAEMTVEPRDR